MSDKSMAVDLQVLDQASAGLNHAVEDMTSMLNDLCGDDYTILPAAFTLLDPGAMTSYDNVRHYMVTFLTTMRDRFENMIGDLQAVTRKYGETDTGMGGEIRDIGTALDGISTPPAAGHTN